MSKKNIAIIGDGGWGTALALHLNRLGHSVTLFSAFEAQTKALRKARENKAYLKGFKLPRRIKFSSDLEATFTANEVIVLAVPTQFLRSVITPLAKVSKRGKLIVNVAKGIEVTTLESPYEIMQDVFGKVPLAVLSGPSHAEEVAKQAPAAVVIASKNKKLRDSLQKIFISERFRVYTSSDVIGLELAGALKNVIAIAAGACDGLAYGDNAKSALLARGLAEMTRLGVKMGAKPETFSGLAGLGDLATTCFSPHGRNRAVGEKLGRGKSIKQIQSEMKMVAEGVATAKAVHTLAKKCKVDMPISEEVYRVLYKGKSAKTALHSLMNRKPKSE